MAVRLEAGLWTTWSRGISGGIVFAALPSARAWLPGRFRATWPDTGRKNVGADGR